MESVGISVYLAPSVADIQVGYDLLESGGCLFGNHEKGEEKMRSRKDEI